MSEHESSSPVSTWEWPASVFQHRGEKPPKGWRMGWRMVEGGGQMAAPAGKAQLRTMEGELEGSEPP